MRVLMIIIRSQNDGFVECVAFVCATCDNLSPIWLPFGSHLAPIVRLMRADVKIEFAWLAGWPLDGARVASANWQSQIMCERPPHPFPILIGFYKFSSLSRN